MKSLALAVLILGAGLVGRAAANPFATHHSGSPVVASGGFTVPVEWAGVWTFNDTTYKCPGILQGTSTGNDTLCTGEVIDAYPNGTCTGTSDLNTIDETCTASGEIFTDCSYNISFHIHGTRSGDTFSSVTTINTTYTGTGAGCDLLPPSCQQVNSHATRIGPAPPEFCATPVQPSTWGKMKAAYR